MLMHVNHSERIIGLASSMTDVYGRGVPINQSINQSISLSVSQSVNQSTFS